MRRNGAGILLGAVGVWLGLTGAAKAEPSIDTRTFRPSTDPAANLVLEPTSTPGPWNFHAAAFASYANGPITLRNAGTDDVAYRPVLHLLGMDLVGSLGIGNRVTVGALVPVILYQSGSENLPPTVAQRTSVPASGMGDVSLTLKGSLVDNKSGGFGAAVITAMGLPTGDRSSFMGDGSVNMQARLLADYSLVFAGLQGSLGYRARTAYRTWPDEKAGGVRFGDELPWTFGLWVKPTIFGIDDKNRQRMELAAHGSLPAGPVGPFGSGDPGSAALTPVLLTVSDRYEIGRFRDFFVLGGVDIGLTQAVGVPTLRGVAAFGWAPR
ncbi:MAG: hypothetical protein JNL38_27285, partial [Myxococcales bacterium]|nr:hypothetical protein [Myxococcales bacterium]